MSEMKKGNKHNKNSVGVLNGNTVWLGLGQEQISVLKRLALTQTHSLIHRAH